MISKQIDEARLTWLLAGWSNNDGPLHQQLSDTMAELIALGELPPGTRLPSERSLADTLAVSRTTVLSAYNTLRRQGSIDSLQGSGTWVQDGHTAPPYSESHGDLVTAEEGLLRFNSRLPTVVDMSSAVMPGLAMVTDTITNLPLHALQDMTAGHGYAPRGLPQLREGVAGQFTEAGLPTNAGQILITGGAQQALEVVVASTLAQGDPVVVENPTYRGALQAFNAIGAQLLPVPSGPHGADIDAIEHAITTARPRLVYVLPTAQNPTGATMPEAARRRLAQLASSSGTLLVDDASPADTLFRRQAPPPLAAYAPQQPIVTLGSCSKLFWGGLRVGWIRAPATMIARFAKVKKGVSELGTSLLSQLVTTQLLASSDLARTQRREQLASGYAELTRLLEELLPSWSWQPAGGGASLWVRIPHACATTFTQLALRHGVAVIPGPVFSPTGDFEDHLRLPFGLKLSTMQTGVRRLAEAWEAHMSIGHSEVIGSEVMA